MPETGEVEVAMKTIVAMVVCGVVAIAVGHEQAGAARGGGWHQAQQQTQKPEEKPAPAKPGDAGKAANPVKVTAESLALGKKFYGTDCAVCHGPGGAGDGDLAADMTVKPKDLRELAAKEMTDGEIYKIISKGKAPMLGEEGRLEEREIWSVVNYVRSLGKTKT